MPSGHVCVRLSVWLMAIGLCGPSALAVDRWDAWFAAGEFSSALKAASELPAAERDPALARIALAQTRAIGRQAALSTLRRVADPTLRMQTLAALRDGQPSDVIPPGGGQAGGAAQADFESLIELITTTVAADSWDEVGGPGSIREFPGGVFVDPDGLIERTLATVKHAELLSSARQEALRNPPSRTADDARRESRLRYVSLPRLERELAYAAAAGEAEEEVFTTLAGLRRVDYIFVLEETGDLVLAGPAGDWRRDDEGRLISTATGAPVLHLEDLVVLLRRQHRQGSTEFGCAITPRQENLSRTKAFLEQTAKQPLRPRQRKAWLQSIRDNLGVQEIRVFGLDPRTRVARILVEADYRMKLVGMGLEEGVPGVESYLDSIRIKPGEAPPPMNVLRWWFTLNYEAIVATPDRDGYLLRGPGVKVLSENELISDEGARIHTGSADELTAQFAASFTSHFAALAEKYPIYAELRNVFDLAVIVALMRSEGLLDRVHWDAAGFLDARLIPVTLATPPTQVMTVVNLRVVNRRHILAGASGGVSIDTEKLFGSRSVEIESYGVLDEHRTRLPDRLGATAWWWDAP